jgi:hypothetical protein
MTRRGSLIYYLAAWVFGCVPVSITIWLNVFVISRRNGIIQSDFIALLLAYTFYGLLLGAFPAFVSAFIVRRLMTGLKLMKVWQWSLGTMFVAPVVLVGLGVVGRKINNPMLPNLNPVALLTYGAEFLLESGMLWLALPTGAITGCLLFTVERAFAPQPQAQPTT